MKFFTNLQTKFSRFMYGRTGLDYCNQLITFLCLILLIIMIIVKNSIAYYILLATILALYIILICRYLSKNLPKRSRESAFFWKIRNKIVNEWKLLKNKWRDRKTHVYKKCPKCRSVLRLKRIKGKHSCNCPHCGTKVTVNIHIVKNKKK